MPELDALLDKIINSGKSEKRHVDRAKLIKSIADGGSNQSLSQSEGVNYKTVKKWRLKWLSYEPAFSKILLQQDKKESKKLKELEEKFKEFLNDRARPGAPMTYTAKQYCQLLEIALQKPEEYGRPINDWTARELAEEAIKQGIFGSISSTQVRRFLKKRRT